MTKLICIESYNECCRFTKGKAYNVKQSKFLKYWDIVDDVGHEIPMGKESILSTRYFKILSCDNCIKRKCNSCLISENKDD